MSHPYQRRPILRSPLLLVAALASAPAHAGWFAGFDFGSAAMSETGSFGAPTAGFGSPTLDLDLCGGTATITVGTEPRVQRIDDRSSDYSVFIGRRFGAFSVELGAFNVARFEGERRRGPLGVVQPTCNPIPVVPITVAARSEVRTLVNVDGFSITPAYSWAFAEDWSLDLRARFAFWQAEELKSWEIVATELSGGAPYQSYAVDVARSEANDEGTDLWPGIGLSWEASDGVRLRGLVERQAFDELSATAWSVGIAIDFP